MPSYTSIINSLLRFFPSEKATQVFKAVQKLHPQSEALANSQLTRLMLDEQLDGWLTRHAWEACRGWNWPFWINVQTHPESPAFTSFNSSPLLQNIGARDAAPIPGLRNTFCGTVDRRGMVTPPHGHFSIETWFRFPDGMLVPAQLLDDNEITVHATSSAVAFEIKTTQGTVGVTVEASGSDTFQYIRMAASCAPVADTESCPVSIYFAIRPYTLEAVVPIHDLVYNSKGFWMSDNRVIAYFPHRPDIAWASDARHGDAAFFINAPPERTAVRCPAGLATSLSAWHLPLRDSASAQAEIIIPLHPTNPKAFPFVELVQQTRDATIRKPDKADRAEQSGEAIVLNTHTAVDGLLEMSSWQLSCLVDIADTRLHHQFLRRSSWLVAAVRALLYQGHAPQAERLLQLPSIDMQKNGNLSMSAGKWSLQGQFLTAVADYHRLAQVPADRPVIRYGQLRNVARWIMRKRREIAHAPEKPQGLLPPGVTRSNTGAEYQLADNLWGLQGLVSAGWLARHFNEHRDADVLHKEASKYASNISAAIHRELEYSLSQQVPARLHQAFDTATASELLEISLMPDVFRMLKAGTWLGGLVDLLVAPVERQPLDLRYVLRRIDEQGVFPARRMLLCMAMRLISHPRTSELFAELKALQTPLHVWPECLNPHTSLGSGRDLVDIEATALFTVLSRQLILQEDDTTLTFSPEDFPVAESSDYVFSLAVSPTMHGAVTATLVSESGNVSLDLTKVTDDPTVEVFWKRPHETVSLGNGKDAAGRYTHKLPAFTNNPGR